MVRIRQLVVSLVLPVVLCVAGVLAHAAVGDGWSGSGTQTHGAQTSNGQLNSLPARSSSPSRNDTPKRATYTVFGTGKVVGQPDSPNNENALEFDATRVTFRDASGTTVFGKGRLVVGGDWTIGSYGDLVFPSCTVLRGHQYLDIVPNQPSTSSIAVSLIQR